MSELTKKDRVRATLSGEPTDRAPVSLWGHDFLREWSAEDLAANTLDAYRPYDWDFIKFNPRATYFAEAWGNKYERPTEQRQPRPMSFRVTDASQLRVIEPVDARVGVFGEHLAALRMLLHDVDGTVDVLHTLFSPLSVTAMLAGPPDAFLGLAKADPAGAHAAIAAVTRTLTEYAAASLEAGAAGIFYAPLTWASRDTAPDGFYREYGRPYDLQILDSVRGAEFNVLHVCRNNNMIDLLLDYPVVAFNWADRGEGNASLADIRTRTPKAVMGGVDHAHLHKMSPDEVKSQAHEAVAGGATRTFVTGGCAIPPQTPAANRQALADAVRG